MSDVAAVGLHFKKCRPKFANLGLSLNSNGVTGIVALSNKHYGGCHRGTGRPMNAYKRNLEKKNMDSRLQVQLEED